MTNCIKYNMPYVKNDAIYAMVRQVNK